MRLGLPVATIRRQVPLPLRFPDGYATTACASTFDGLVDGREHLALGLGDRATATDDASPSDGPPLVRPHSECLTGDVLGSLRCDCGPQLREAVEQISATGGFLLYLRQEGRGIGLYRKLDAYGIAVTERVRTGVHESAANVCYLRAKREHTAHTLDLAAL